MRARSNCDRLVEPGGAALAQFNSHSHFSIRVCMILQFAFAYSDSHSDNPICNGWMN
jgi:hypothetical protein